MRTKTNKGGGTFVLYCIVSNVSNIVSSKEYLETKVYGYSSQRSNMGRGYLDWNKRSDGGVVTKTNSGEQGERVKYW